MNLMLSPDFFQSVEQHWASLLQKLQENGEQGPAVHEETQESITRFNQTVLLQMKKHCTTRKVRSDCAKAAPKFTLMLKVLSVIYRLVQSDTYATKRDIYYNEVQLYGSQTVVDNIISDISCMLKIPRISLYILSASKGCVAGYLWFTAEDGNKVYCGGSSSGVLVPITVEGIRNLSTQAKFILIMEKEAIFQRLLNDNFCAVSGSYILITVRLRY
ncbi:hypothetical protein XELAEV_18046215mg [Xenopus laevis]|uniref:Spo11/DNA topoisomerase VI subunit A N-terminal domain-containing protein n=1 Tax=Xenopus laevis TaxID=8355 RepID=A0A974H0E0_XENLA|nr:hypothetical protein XELAEV_18046215mg [Xenopus laevis]